MSRTGSGERPNLRIESGTTHDPFQSLIRQRNPTRRTLIHPQNRLFGERLAERNSRSEENATHKRSEMSASARLICQGGSPGLPCALASAPATAGKARRASACEARRGPCMHPSIPASLPSAHGLAAMHAAQSIDSPIQPN
jgi:hypothetical protein